MTFVKRYFKRNRQENTLILGLIFIYLLAWFIEAKTMVPGDISLGLYESTSLWSGGSYGKDFFEVNPPLFLYLYMPSVIIAPYVHCHLFTVFHAYIFLLASLSLFLCYHSIKNIFPATDWTYCGSLLLLAFVLLLLPFPTSFGQREHLLVIMTLPYLALMISRLEGYKPNSLLSLVIGLMAGLGFALKPFFCFTLAMIELYYLFRQRSWLAWVRIETLAIAVVFVAYIACIYLFNHSYVTLVLPLILRLYYQAFSVEWSELLLNPVFIVCTLPVIAYFIQRQNNVNKPIVIILLLGLLGFAGSYLIQRTPWYYHLYPAYCLSLLLDFMLLLLLRRKKEFRNNRYIITSATLFFFLFSIPLTCLMKGYLPVQFVSEKSTKLIQFVRQYALHQPVYFLTKTLRFEYPLIDYAQALHSSQYPSTWWLYGYMKQMETAINPEIREQLQQDHDYFFCSIINELKTNKPTLVFVESGKMAPSFKGHRYNYVTEFFKYSEFRKVWKNYHYLTDLDEQNFYHFKVYQRNATA